LGDYYYDTNNFEKAAATYQVACDSYRDDVSCYKYGVQQAQGKGTKLNFAEVSLMKSGFVSELLAYYISSFLCITGCKKLGVRMQKGCSRCLLCLGVFQDER